MNRYLASLALLLFMVPSLRAERGQVPATLSVEVRSSLMLAFLDHWIGQRPLSEEIKQLLLER